MNNKELLERLTKAKETVERLGGTFSLTAQDASEVVDAFGNLVRENEALRRMYSEETGDGPNEIAAILPDYMKVIVP